MVSQCVCCICEPGAHSTKTEMQIRDRRRKSKLYDSRSWTGPDRDGKAESVSSVDFPERVSRRRAGQLIGRPDPPHHSTTPCEWWVHNWMNIFHRIPPKLSPFHLPPLFSIFLFQLTFINHFHFHLIFPPLPLSRPKKRLQMVHKITKHINLSIHIYVLYTPRTWGHPLPF